MLSHCDLPIMQQEHLMILSNLHHGMACALLNPVAVATAGLQINVRLTC